MLNETSCVSGGDRLERLAHSLHQRFSAPGLCLAKKSFDLREGLFDGAKSPARSTAADKVARSLRS